MNPHDALDRRVLHAIWDHEHGRLSLWAESSRLLASALEEGTRRPSHTHPFALGWASLHDCLFDILRSQVTGIEQTEHSLRLPSARGYPLPSPPVTTVDTNPGFRWLFGSRIALRVWQVKSLALAGKSLLDLLASLPATPPAGLLYGDDLLFWRDALYHALSLVVRRKFVPTVGMTFAAGQCDASPTAGPSVDPAADRGYVPTWEPVFDDEEAVWLSEASQRIPPVCLAVADPDREEAIAPAEIQTFVQRCIVTLVHGAAERHMKEQDVLSKWSRLSLPQQWLAGLMTDAPALGGRPGARAQFAYDIWAWSRKASEDLVRKASSGLGAPGDLPGNLRFRLCLRMEPVMSGPLALSGREVGALQVHEVQIVTGWRFRYCLQGEDDPSLIVSAGDIWFSEDYTSSPLSASYEATLLRLLESGSRVLPAIRESLKEPYPTDFVIDHGSLTAFLASTAPKLADHNIGLLTPPWWDKPAAKPRVRLKVRESPGRATGLLGVSSIVDYDWEVAVGQCELTVDQFLTLVKTKAPLVSARGEWVQFDPDEAEAIVEFFERKGSGRMQLGEAVGLGLRGQVPGADLPIDEIRADGRAAEIVSRISNMRGDLRVPVLATPEGFNGQLRPYQARGVSWLVYLRELGFGACLADDMGLGKTVEFLAYLLHLKAGTRNGPSGPLRHEDHACERTGPSLLVCPMSVVGNWEKEIQRFAPSLRVIVHHGQDRLSSDELAAELDGSAGAVGVLVITTYGLVWRCREDLSRVEWDCIALDEAQNIKNPSTKQARAIKRLRARHRVALTGTPVENRLSELWSIMDFLNPGYLGTADAFKRSFAVPIEKRRDGKREEMLSRMIRPFVLRRLKTDPGIVPDLPDKIEMKVYCNLTAEQATLYQAVVEDMLAKIQRATGMERRGLILSTLTKLKQVCNHPAHFLKDRSRMAGRSGKLSRLEEVLEEVIAGNEKALIFTQFAEMGALLQTYLQQRLGCEVLYLHGAVPKHERDRMVARFQGGTSGFGDAPGKGKGLGPFRHSSSDSSSGSGSGSGPRPGSGSGPDSEGLSSPSIFILSLKAGGLGLNLTAANHVFHFDRWWNPAVENQATDRAFRIGQKSNVQVRKLITVGTLEERIDRLIETKRGLADRIVGSGEGWLTELTTEELGEVLALSREAVREADG